MFKPAFALTVIAPLFMTLFLGAAAVSQEKNGRPEPGAIGTVRGRVVVAPACPGPASIDRPECLKRPVRASVNVYLATPSGGGKGKDRPLTTIATDSGGHFRIALPAGAYRLVPVPPPGPARGKPLDVTVTKGASVDVELRIDSGVR